MTKKHFIIIATAIWRSGYIPDKNKVKQQAREAMRRLIMSNLMGELKEDNPKFNAQKFAEACGLPQMKQ